MATAAQTKPYSGPKDPKLPDHVKKMSDAQRATWVRTFNGVMDESDDESQAMRLANAAAKRTGKKDLLPDDLSNEDIAVLGAVALNALIAEEEKAAPTKREAGADYHAGDFADVPDADKPSTWKLRLADPPGTMNALQISQAITALQPGGFRGNPVQLGTSREAAVRKISAAIGKLGDEDAQKRLRDRLGKVKGSSSKELLMAADQLPTPELVALAKEHGHDLGAKCEMCDAAMPVPYQPYGGATSFSEVDSWREAMKVEMHIVDTTGQFQALQQNIFADDEMDAEEKASALASLAREFQTRVRQMPEEEKALLDGERVGRRMNKQQAGLFKGAIETLQKLVGWANYEGEDDEDGKKKALASDSAEALATSFKVYREPDGTYRWVTYSSNAFEDLEKELFSTKALEDAVNYADLSGERGPLRVFHIPGADVGACDFQSMVGRVLVESGTFYPNPTGAAALKFFKDAEANGEKFGVSIGYLYEKGDETDGIYDWLRIKERSVTPAGRAANPFTSFSLGGIPVLQITDEKKAFLERVVGKDNAAGIISQAERATKALVDAGVRFKENGDPELVPFNNDAGDQTQTGTTTTAAATVAAESGEGEAQTQGDAEAAKQIIAMLGENTKGMEALALAMKAINDRLDKLEKSDDEKIAAQLGPRRVAPNAVQRPSEKAGNDITNKTDAVSAILERNRVNGGDKDGSLDGSGEADSDYMSPYIADLYRTLNLEPTPAGAAAS